MNHKVHEEDQAWTDYQLNFHTSYDRSNYESPLQTYVMHASHRLVESPFSEHDRFSRVLEIGAGTGEHIPFVQHGFDEYILSDINSAALEIARRKLKGHHAGKLQFDIQNGAGPDYAPASFDRIVAAHVLEHINSPHLAIKQWRTLLRPGGILSVLIPTDPGVAWRLGRHLGPRRAALRAGIAYDYVMAREHVNSCTNLIALLAHYFPHHRHAWWPCRISSVDLNLFFAFHATIEG